MKHKLPPVLFAVSLLFSAVVAHAQTTFNVGPRLGLNVSNVTFQDEARTYNTTARAGLEAGVVANVGFGHFAVQPALLYSQKGFAINDTYTEVDNRSGGGIATTTLDEHYRLSYFTIPLNLMYTQHPGGQGAQVFAGPYLGFLLGGTYRYDDTYTSTAAGTTPSYDKGAGSVGIGNYYTTNRTDTKFYSRAFDFGLQFGLGYRLGHALLQAGYSLGADYQVNYGSAGTVTGSGPTYQSRVFQVSAAYLFGPTP